MFILLKNRVTIHERGQDREISDLSNYFIGWILPEECSYANIWLAKGVFCSLGIKTLILLMELITYVKVFSFLTKWYFALCCILQNIS